MSDLLGGRFLSLKPLKKLRIFHRGPKDKKNRSLEMKYQWVTPRVSKLKGLDLNSQLSNPRQKEEKEWERLSGRYDLVVTSKEPFYYTSRKVCTKGRPREHIINVAFLKNRLRSRNLHQSYFVRTRKKSFCLEDEDLLISRETNISYLK